MMKTINTKLRRTPRYLILVFLVLSIAIWTGGYSYYKYQKEHIREELQKKLTAIADLKVQQISDWRNEHIADAEAIHANPFMVQRVRVWLERGAPHQLRGEILGWMATLKKLYRYHSILLVDEKGTVRLSLPAERGKTGKHARELFPEALSAKKVIFSDLHRAEHMEDIHIELVVPLLTQKGDEPVPFGGFIIRIDPYAFLYPFIQSWPIPNETAETILVRREGNEVLYLNELRHKKNTALSFKMPVTKKHLPSVMATEGYEGIFDAVSYRGVPVLAVTRSIPGTSWHLVAQVDAEEIYAPIREQFWVITLIVTLVILASGIGIVLVWRHQRADFYRRQYEVKRRHSLLLERFEYLTKYANDIILLADENYRIVEANERAVQSYGYERDELLRLQLHNLRTPEARKLFDEQMKGVKEKNGLVFETEHQRKDGTPFPVEVSSRGIDIEGKMFYQYIIRDISERKRTDETLRESEAFIRAVLDNLPVGIAVNSVDPAVEFEYMNDNFPRYYRTTREKLAEPDAFWGAVYEDPEFREQIKKRVREDCSSGDPERMLWIDIPIRRKGDRTTFISARNIPVPSKNLMISVVWDVSERKEVEEELKKYREQLERLVRERTAELENANRKLELLNSQLVQRQKETEDAKFRAEEATRAKSDFLANMSHELRTPLNSIIGFSEILQDEMYGDLNAQQKEYVNDVLTSGKHLLNLINDILDLSKIEAGKMELEPNKFRIRDVLDTALTMLREKAIKHAIQLNLVIEPDADREVEADERKLKQIMFNLLSNAVKFTPDGGSVCVAARRVKSSELGVRREPPVAEE